MEEGVEKNGLCLSSPGTYFSRLCKDFQPGNIHKIYSQQHIAVRYIGHDSLLLQHHQAGLSEEKKELSCVLGR